MWGYPVHYFFFWRLLVPSSFLEVSFLPGLRPEQHWLPSHEGPGQRRPGMLHLIDSLATQAELKSCHLIISNQNLHSRLDCSEQSKVFRTHNCRMASHSRETE